jgi:hypothetical protein
MKKVLLLIDCDSCRQLYTYSRLASEDTTAWEHHGNHLIDLALREGWAESDCRNFQYCPRCFQDYEELISGSF